jgi:hypothetical protein
MTALATLRQARLKGWLGAMVVLVFGLRALIPSGYMLASVEGHSRLVICPSGLHYAAGMHTMAGMTHGSGMAPGAHATFSAEHCPFALAGGAALYTSSGVWAEPGYVILQPKNSRAPASIPIAPPTRYDAARGPPTLA